MACPSGRIQIRRDNYEAWEAIDPLLNPGELGYAYPSITDPLKEPKGVLKIGGLYGSRWKTSTQLFPTSAGGAGATGPTQTTASFQFIGISGNPTITNIAQQGYSVTINSSLSPSVSDQVICVNPQLFNLSTSGVVFTCRLPSTTGYANNSVQVGFGDAYAVLSGNKLSYYVDDGLKVSNIDYTANQTLSITYNGSGQVVFKLMTASSGPTGPTPVVHDIKSYSYTATEDYGFIGYKTFDQSKQTIITYANIYPVGVQGIQGVTGPSGVQGLTGPQGVTGASGVQGVTGVSGVQGVTGPSGVQGLTGPQGVTGASGVQGVTGPSGVQGLTGPQGVTGASGVQGLTGPQGVTGASGVQGLQGVTGPSGAQGLQGVTGASGVQGVTGPSGAQGLEGVTGASGVQGVTGPSGAQGLEGVTGASGVQGVTGPSGAQGLEGVTGASGVQGLTGPQGVTGASGVQGLQGVTGVSGVQGLQGVTGASGVQGVTGPAGPSSTYFSYKAQNGNGANPGSGSITWSNFTTQTSSTYVRVSHIDQNGVDVDIFLKIVNQGDKLIIQDANASDNFQTWLVSGTPIIDHINGYVQYPVTPVGSGYNFTNNHQIILALITSGVQGFQGVTGASGVHGVTGPSGAQGQQGVTGVSGVQGPQGVTGPSGVQGLTGPQGVTGASGVQGVTGPSGAQGQQGVTGVSGVQGVTGPSGAQGLQGVTGASGVQGLLGVTGVSGVQGVTGPSGAQGLQGVTGASGVQGIQGVTGPSGVQGVTGASGVQGLTGPQGVTGASGAQGLQGITGPAPSIIVNVTVAGTIQALSDLSRGTFYNITNSGFTTLTTPSGTITDGAFWVLRNNTSTYLSITPSGGNTGGLPIPFFIPPSNSVTLVWITSTTSFILY
jgi:hypothetical protein